MMNRWNDEVLQIEEFILLQVLDQVKVTLCDELAPIIKLIRKPENNCSAKGLIFRSGSGY
jgi:hypothetical protein